MIPAELLRSGDPLAWDKFNREAWPTLLRVVSPIVGDDDAGTIVSEALERARKAAGSLHGEPLPWVKQIARNAAKDLLRKRGRLAEEELPDEIADQPENDRGPSAPPTLTFPPGRWPKVVARDEDPDVFRWKYPEDPRPYSQRFRPDENPALVWQRGSSTLLAEFAALGALDDNGDEIRRFLLDRGVLGLCRHGLPATHAPETPLMCQGVSDFHVWEERIERVRSLARLFRSILLVRAQHVKRRMAEPADIRDVRRRMNGIRLIDFHYWDSEVRADESLEEITQRFGYLPLGSALLDGHPDPVGSNGEPRYRGQRNWTTFYEFDSLETEENYIRGVVDEILRIGAVRIAMAPKGWRLEATTKSGLFGSLALQLALSVSKAAGIEECAACHEFFAPKRRPRPDRRNYCARCQRNGAARKDTKNRSRAKARADERAASLKTRRRR